MQNTFAIIIVAVAVIYLVWRVWQFFFAKRKAAGCASGCSQCPADGKSQALVTLNVKKQNGH